jgi:CRISPR/Cas system Type II protein with McrA/HNH and RuvC-like nuclease domain
MLPCGSAFNLSRTKAKIVSLIKQKEKKQFMKKKILGLDIGTNSIGWALIEKDGIKNEGNIIGMGSRIVPMDDNREFEQGQPVTRNAIRRMARGMRKGNHRYKNRRNKLIYVLDKLGLLPIYLEFGYESKDENGKKILIENRFPPAEKLQSLYLKPIRKGIKHLTAKQIFELKIKGLNNLISDYDLGKIIYQYNQKRGYSGGGGEEEKDAKTKSKERKDEYKIEYRTLKIENIEPVYQTEIFKHGKGKNKKETRVNKYFIEFTNLDGGEVFTGYSYYPLEKETTYEIEFIPSHQNKSKGVINIPNADYRFETNSDDLKLLTVRINTCEKAQELKKIGKKFYPLYSVTFNEIDLPENEKLGIGPIALSDLDKKDFEIGKEVEVECRITIDEKGDIKKVVYATPNKTNWRKQMESIEKEITKKQKEIGKDQEGRNKYFLSHYFLERFEKDDRKQWFRVKENVILRKRYKEEFEAIWNKQLELNPRLKENVSNTQLLKEVVEYVFPGKSKSQEDLRNKALEEGFKYLIKEMIIYYQRPLKPQSHTISSCQYETDRIIDPNDPEKKRLIPKHPVLPVSHPLYQEFRIWDQINRIYIEVKQPEGSKRKYKKRLLTIEERKRIYETLHKQKEINFNKLVELLDIPSKRTEKKDNKRIVVFDDFIKGLHVKRSIKGNETLYEIRKLFGTELFEQIFGAQMVPYRSENFFKLWSLLFNQYGNEVDLDDPRVMQIRQLITDEIKRFNIEKTEDEFETLLKNLAAYKFPRKYGSLSEKAINNILPLMQVEQELSQKHKERIEKLKLTYEEYKDILKDYSAEDEKQTGFSIALLKDHFQEYLEMGESIDKGGWMNWAACQLMYGRHTAEIPKEIFSTPSQITQLKPEETLRNPVVEQIVNEALQVVKDIWKTKKFGVNNKELEIRVELARELKNSAEERKAMFEGIINNEKLNREAINEIMQTITYDSKGKPKKLENNCNGNEYGCSPKLCPLQRIPTKNEITKYKLWKSQGFFCPYTNTVIPMCKLFSEDGSAEYNKEHIIPKQRFFDNSNANLVIADRQANALKDNLTAVEFIKKWGGHTLQNGKKILEWKAYEQLVKDRFRGQKLKYLLLEKIPDGFVERQIKDTQYIARKVKEKLIQIVGEKNVVTTTGSITDYLRENWGLNQSFKELTQDRFKLMALTAGENPEDWVQWEEREFDGVKKNVLLIKPEVWNKRLDHRHHAIDALVVAATNQGMITQLNTLHQKVQDYISNKKEELLKAIGEDENKNLSDDEIMEIFAALKKEKRDEIMKELGGINKFDLPWKSFMEDAKIQIQNIIVSHKRKQKILIQKQHVRDSKTGEEKEEWQLKIRGALHQETVYGKIKLDTPKVKPVLIKSAFSLAGYIEDPVHKKLILERLDAFDGDIEEAVESLKHEKIKIEQQVTGKKGIKIKQVDLNRTTLIFTEKDVYRLPIEKFGEKKNVDSFIDKVVNENMKIQLNDHLYRYCLSLKLEDKENPLDDILVDKIKALLKEKISEKTLEIFYDSLKDSNEKTKVKSWLNGKLAFSGDGLKVLNRRRKHPIIAVRVLDSKTVKTEALKRINRGYVKPGDNYCMLVMQNDKNRFYESVSFFDAVNWVTEQFNIDKQSNYPFPEYFDEKVNYINNIIIRRFKKENPVYANHEVLFILQQNDLVEFTHPETKEKKIFKAVMISGSQCDFIPHTQARHIIYRPISEIEKNQSVSETKKKKEIQEYGSYKNRTPYYWDDKKLKEGKNILIIENCVPLKVNRLGIITPPH